MIIIQQIKKILEPNIWIFGVIASLKAKSLNYFKPVFQPWTS